jgi:hypothetical protein
MRLILSTLVLGALATGCYATPGTTTVAYSGGVATTVGPDLVYVSPGVQVIADYNEPIFYSNGFYWREYNGGWYRSRYHTHGWGYSAPPRAVVSIGNRGHYRHYRPSGYVRRDYRNQHQNRPNYQAPRRDDRNVRKTRDHRNDRDDRNDKKRNNNYQRPRR